MAVVTMIAGPNGSGKSTLYRDLVAEGMDFGEYLNADDIARELSESGAEAAQLAQSEVRMRREALLAQGKDYCFETVMSHPSHVEHLKSARDAGYEVQLLYVSLEDPEMNKMRVAARVLSGGHDVPTERISKRYYRSIYNLASAILVSNDALIFDNSSAKKSFQLIASVEAGVLSLERGWFELPRWFVPALVAINAR